MRAKNREPDTFAAYLQNPLLIVFSVQFAAESMSSATPRTVLQAVTARQNPMKSTGVLFPNMVVSLLDIPALEGSVKPGLLIQHAGRIPLAR